MATTTEYYELIKPGLADSPPDITVLNDNFDAIDSAMHTNAEAISALETANDGKMAKDTTATAGNVAVFDENGNCIDGESQLSDVSAAIQTNANNISALQTSNASKMPKATGAGTGNVAVFDANGNCVDGGTSFSTVNSAIQTNANAISALQTSDASKMSKVSGAGVGNIAVYDSNGAVVDGGLKFTIVDGGLVVTYNE